MGRRKSPVHKYAKHEQAQVSAAIEQSHGPKFEFQGLLRGSWMSQNGRWGSPEESVSKIGRKGEFWLFDVLCCSIVALRLQCSLALPPLQTL
jgi:hypothetical protein